MHKGEIKKNKLNALPRLWHIVWRSAWVVQAALWGFLVLLTTNYWVDEVPTAKKIHAAGLVQGFDGMAGIVASINPDWKTTQTIRGNKPALSRFSTLLANEKAFTVWTERDETPSWNAGLARLQFDRQHRLSWVRRYCVPEKAIGFMQDSEGKMFPVVKPRPIVSGFRNNNSGARY